MFRKTASVFGVLMLLLISFNTYSFAQAFTQEEIDQQMEETRILFEEAQEEMEQEVDTIIEEEQESVTEDSEERQDEFYESFEEQQEKMYDTYEEASKTILESQNNIKKNSKGLFLGTTLIFVLVALYLVAGVILNVIMLLDCLKRDFKDRTLWIVILIGGTFLGFGVIPGILYYFLVKKKLPTTEKKEKEE
ncbi:MAG TPA: hypothetical protein P5059_03620 [Candidatus Dojkabacteria bacterium]|nr:hypothetical protein [Candidatus Dojkabacteria bacterium]